MGAKKTIGCSMPLSRDAEAVLRQACHKFALAIEDASVNFDDFSCGLNSCLWNPSGFLRVQTG